MAVTVVTTGLRFPEGPVVLPDGDVVVVEVLGGRLTRVAPDGTKTVVADLGGGPNGAQLGPDGRVYVVNNGGMVAIPISAKYTAAGGTPPDYVSGSVQAVDLETGAVQVLYTESQDGPLRGPNDIVFDAAGNFYFTDHGKSDALKSDRGRLFYASPDGSFIRKVADGMEGPNGIGLSPDGTRLYVSETYTSKVWWWEVTGPGEISGGRSLMGSGGGNFLYAPDRHMYFDSLGVEAGGNVCVASLAQPGITVVAPEGGLVEFVPLDVDGDPGITNIAWGGPDLRTAYITASATGTLVKVDWPRPGLPLHYGVGER